MSTWYQSDGSIANANDKGTLLRYNQDKQMLEFKVNGYFAVFCEPNSRTMTTTLTMEDNDGVIISIELNKSKENKSNDIHHGNAENKKESKHHARPKLSDTKHLKQCAVCKRIQRDQKPKIKPDNQNKMRYVEKIRKCKCKNLMVCSRKCYKYAWSKCKHRNSCSSKLQR